MFLMENQLQKQYCYKPFHHHPTQIHIRMYKKAHFRKA